MPRTMRRMSQRALVARAPGVRVMRSFLAVCWMALSRAARQPGRQAVGIADGVQAYAVLVQALQLAHQGAHQQVHQASTSALGRLQFSVLKA